MYKRKDSMKEENKSWKQEALSINDYSSIELLKDKIREQVAIHKNCNYSIRSKSYSERWFY
jgi:hypothetical protein